MSEQWQYQVRIYLADEFAEMARCCPADPALRPIMEILERHSATLVSQFDAFVDYVADAEQQGPENFPLYKWTKATVEDPVKRAKHIRTFALRVAGKEVYAADTADALEADMRQLVGGVLVERLSRHDTNPANNLPVPPEYRS